MDIDCPPYAKWPDRTASRQGGRGRAESGIPSRRGGTASPVICRPGRPLTIEIALEGNLLLGEATVAVCGRQSPDLAWLRYPRRVMA